MIVNIAMLGRWSRGHQMMFAGWTSLGAATAAALARNAPATASASTDDPIVAMEIAQLVAAF